MLNIDEKGKELLVARKAAENAFYACKKLHEANFPSPAAAYKVRNEELEVLRSITLKADREWEEHEYQQRQANSGRRQAEMLSFDRNAR